MVGQKERFQNFFYIFPSVSIHPSTNAPYVSNGCHTPAGAEATHIR